MERIIHINDNQETWFNKLKNLGEKYGFASNHQDYQNQPEKYKGQIGSLAQLLRFLLTGRMHTPNLCLVMQIMGQERITKRLNVAFLKANFLKSK